MPRNDPGPGSASLAALLAFNYAPASYADPSWIAAMAPESQRGNMPRDLFESPRFAKRLSRLLVVQSGGGATLPFSAAPQPLALESGATILRVVDLCGAIVHAKDVRACISGALRAALVDRIGSRGYEFVVKRVPFLRPAIQEAATGDLLRAVRESGAHCLGAWLATEGEAVERRVVLKLPKGLPRSPHHREAGVDVLRMAVRAEGLRWTE